MAWLAATICVVAAIVAGIYAVAAFKIAREVSKMRRRIEEREARLRRSNRVTL